LSIIVLGGGAAGFFAAIAAAENGARVHLLERTGRVLAKVAISGGGRCNVTHACFDPADLVSFYPRGGAALRGPFTRFQPRDTVRWFESRGVALKTEPDGRIFPISDQSQTIIDCLVEQARAAGVRISLNVLVETIGCRAGGGFTLRLPSGERYSADRLIVATGSNPQAWRWAEALGHTIEPPVPSLFTFAVKDARLEGLSGLSVPKATLRLEGSPFARTGALLVTHWGLSGPAVLALSAWGARWLHDATYQARLRINWISDFSTDAVTVEFANARRERAKKNVYNDPLFGLPRRLWSRLTAAAGIPDSAQWANMPNVRLAALTRELREPEYAIIGKGVFKDEFVTCGGVRLDEVDFRTMESKLVPGLYFAGEVLDIDGVTGGFNFQSAWTTGWIAGTHGCPQR